MNRRALVIGTIAIAAPRVRIHKGDIERHGASVIAAAREISGRLFGRHELPGRKLA